MILHDLRHTYIDIWLYLLSIVVGNVKHLNMYTAVICIPILS